MKKLVLILSLISTSAFAEEAKFAPYTIDQDTHNKFMTFLGDQPAKFSIPLIQVLVSLEQKALEANAPKPPAPEKH